MPPNWTGLVAAALCGAALNGRLQTMFAGPLNLMASIVSHENCMLPSLKFLLTYLKTAAETDNLNEVCDERSLRLNVAVYESCFLGNVHTGDERRDQVRSDGKHGGARCGARVYCQLLRVQQSDGATEIALVSRRTIQLARVKMQRNQCGTKRQRKVARIYGNKFVKIKIAQKCSELDFCNMAIASKYNFDI